MRCLEALGEWDELEETSKEYLEMEEDERQDSVKVSLSIQNSQDFRQFGLCSIETHDFNCA